MSLLEDLESLDEESDDHPQSAVNHTPDHKKLSEIMHKIKKFHSTVSMKEERYALVMQCNEMMSEIAETVQNLYRNIVDIFKNYFSELTDIVKDLVQYVMTVEKFCLEGNNTDLSIILTQAQLMTITLSEKMTHKLISDDKTKLLSFCSTFLESMRIKEKILLPFVSTQVAAIAPNMCCLVSTDIAASLLSLAGGLESLTKIPAGNLKAIGKKDNLLYGFSKVAGTHNSGILYLSELVQKTSLEHRKKVMNTLSGRIALCARLDLKSSEVGNLQGKIWREQIENKISKWEKPNPGKMKQALPNPEPKRRTKRGGRRIRKRKERLAQTEMHKNLNRVSFAETGDEYDANAMGNELGLLGNRTKLSSRSFTKLRIVQKESQKVKKQKKVMKENINLRLKEKLRGVSASIGGAITSGTATSIIMTPYQGMEFVNPNVSAANKRKHQTENSWLDAGKSFSPHTLGVETKKPSKRVKLEK